MIYIYMHIYIHIQCIKLYTYFFLNLFFNIYTVHTNPHVNIRGQRTCTCNPSRGFPREFEEWSHWERNIRSFSWTFGRLSGCSLKKDKKTTKWKYMGVSKNRGTPKSSNLIGFSIINHPFWGTTIFGNTHILLSCARFQGVQPFFCWFLIRWKTQSVSSTSPASQRKRSEGKKELGEMTAKHSRH